ncbi:MAG: DUF2628 domain-containing protein [Eubacterium sp.]|nr:DUF2628 domain-containing protein [Eubacterium sp.]
MFLYENNKCPVCNKQFEKGDDVVVCPDCGTPHHRECYQSIGKCANKDKHESGFVYDREKYKKEHAEELKQEDLPGLAKEIKTVVEALENADLQNEETADSEVKQKETNEATIEGVPVSDVATVVGVHSDRFVKRFSKKRKLGWNWGAFFFGPYYFMYRKMYGESLIFLAVSYFVSAVINHVYESAILVLFNVIKNLYVDINAVVANYGYKLIFHWNEVAAILKNAWTAPDNKPAWTVLLVTLAASLLLKIIATVIADSQYRKKVVKIIKIVDEKVDLGESFSLVGPIGNQNMSQSDLRKMFLAKQGGVNIFFPLILLVLYVFSSMV